MNSVTLIYANLIFINVKNRMIIVQRATVICSNFSFVLLKSLITFVFISIKKSIKFNSISGFLKASATTKKIFQSINRHIIETIIMDIYSLRFEIARLLFTNCIVTFMKTIMHNTFSSFQFR